MNIVRQLNCNDFKSTFITGSVPIDTRKPTTKTGFSLPPVRAICYRACEGPLLAAQLGIIPKPIPENSRQNHTKLFSVATGTNSVTETSDIESLFSNNDTQTRSKKGGRQNLSGASSISSGVRLENISKSFKGVTVLKDVTWEVKKGEKVGLVGVNGSGKTTQLKIIVGEEEPDSGQVIKAKHNMKIAFLTQEFEVVPTRTVREEFLNAFEEQLEVQQKIDRVQKALESAVDDMNLMGRLLDELDFLQKQADAVELYDMDVKINKMMPELGFSQEDGDRLVASFSGGWQMRISLGKILLQEPDLLLLDEPTNHLDLDTIEWLEGYLKKQDVPMVVVSHDRAFLDQLCTKIIETDMGISKTYEGNYSEYVAAKAAWIEAQHMAWEKQQKEIDHTKDMINRLSAGASSGRASSAEKKLEKLQDENSVEKPFEHKPIKFRFPELERSGKTVVMIKNLAFEYDGKVLFKKANLLVQRGEKLAIIGPNGCGKTTLLRLIMGYEESTQGQVQLGEHNVNPNYFEQNQAEVLDLDRTVLETVEMAAENWRIDDIKGLLGRCNFKADMLNRKVTFLSGGEKYYLEKNLEARKRELEREEELELKAPKVKAKSKMSKAEKELRKKQKATSFQKSQAKTKVSKNAKRWN